MDLKMVFSKKIELFELYNLAVHQILILRWLHFEKFNWKFCLIHFQYILSVTSTSPSVSDGVVHFKLTVPTAKLLSSMRPFICFYILGVVQGVSSTSTSGLQIKVVSKNWLQIRTQGPKIPPRRLRKVKNSTKNN